jgi:hypothetical protein
MEGRKEKLRRNGDFPIDGEALASGFTGSGVKTSLGDSISL